MVSENVLFKNLIFFICTSSKISKTTFFISVLVEKKMESFTLFNKYLNFEPINKNQLDSVINYICSNLNSCFYNYSFWYDMYCYSTKNRIVIRHREDKNENALTTLGECVCEKQVINFLKNKDKQCNCDEGCASVYFNAVF